MTCGVYKFGPNRLVPAPQLSPNGLVLKLPESEGRSVCLKPSHNLTNREAVVTVPIPTSGQTPIAKAGARESFLSLRDNVGTPKQDPS